MNDTAMSVLGRMAGSSELNLTEIEISSMYRSGPSLDEYPHNAGRGIDIKSIKSATDPVVFDDSNFIHPVNQSQLGKDVTSLLKAQPEVSQVLTPWSMYSKPHNWDDPNNWRTKPQGHQGQNVRHNNHLHFGIIQGM